MSAMTAGRVRRARGLDHDRVRDPRRPSSGPSPRASQAADDPSHPRRGSGRWPAASIEAEAASPWTRGERRAEGAARPGAALAGRSTLREGSCAGSASGRRPRIRPQIARNTEAGVRGLTAAAFLARSDGMRLRVLLGLRGVGVAVASVVLHFADPDRYPIYDVRVRTALRRVGREAAVPADRRPGGRRTRTVCGSSRPGTACRSGPSTRRSGGSGAASRTSAGRCRPEPRRRVCYAGAAAGLARKRTGRSIGTEGARALTVRPSARRTMGLRYEQQDRVVTITLDRPEAMNAVDPEMHQDLIDAWTRFRDDPEAWVAILTGAGEKAFSAGADLKKLDPAGVRQLGGGAEPQRPGARRDHPRARDLEADHRRRERLRARRGPRADALL